MASLTLVAIVRAFSRVMPPSVSSEAVSTSTSAKGPSSCSTRARISTSLSMPRIAFLISSAEAGLSC